MSTKNTKRPEAARLPQWEGRTALVVDDSRTMRLEMSTLLRQLGFARVLEAEDGRAALQVLERESVIDFLLTDLNMPVMDGVELLLEIERQESRRFCVAVMSGVDQSLLSAVREIAEGSEFVMAGILPKPVTAEALGQALARVDPNRHAVGETERVAVNVSAEEFGAALRSGQVVPYYQPKVRVADGQVYAVEALARWIHPRYGMVPPLAFLDFMEHGELAYPHFMQQLDAALAMLRRGEPLTAGLALSINLPVVLLVVPTLVDDLYASMLGYGLAPERLVLEVTETSVMSNLKASLSTLARMRLKGFGIAMDDYGTGYSSMQQLAKCPFTELKIDRAFVHNSSQNTKLQSILKAAIGICEQLKLVSVAEGCETEADWRLISALGYEVVQGYYYSRPLPESELLRFLAEHPSARS